MLGLLEIMIINKQSKSKATICFTLIYFECFTCFCAFLLNNFMM